MRFRWAWSGITSDPMRKRCTVKELKSLRPLRRIGSTVPNPLVGNGLLRRTLNHPKIQSRVLPVEGSCVVFAAESGTKVLTVLKTLHLKRLYKNPLITGGEDATSVTQWWS